MDLRMMIFSFTIGSLSCGSGMHAGGNSSC
jgi:hypothetical protein